MLEEHFKDASHVCAIVYIPVVPINDCAGRRCNFVVDHGKPVIACGFGNKGSVSCLVEGLQDDAKRPNVYCTVYVVFGVKGYSSSQIFLINFGVGAVDAGQAGVYDLWATILFFAEGEGG